MFNPEMMANMQKMMAENPDMMKNAMDMMQKNPQMMAQAQEQMKNPEMMKNAMNMMNNPDMVKAAKQNMAAMGGSAGAPAAPAIKAPPKPEGTPVEQAEHFKVEGNALSKKGQYSDAAERYEQALALLCVADADCKKLKVDCHNNLAACKMKLKDFEDVVAACSKALYLDSSNFKALLRRGQAWRGLDDNYAALADLERAVGIGFDAQAWLDVANTELRTVRLKTDEELHKEKQHLVEEQRTELVQEATEIKTEGNKWFKEKSYDKAVHTYQKGLHTLYRVRIEESEASWSKQACTLLDACHLNTAACHINTKSYRRAVKHCSAVLHRGPNVKALVRRGQAYACLNEPFLALYDLKKANEIDPGAPNLAGELAKAEARIREVEQAEATEKTAGGADQGEQMSDMIAGMDENTLKGMTDMMANMPEEQLEAMRASNPMMAGMSKEQLAGMRETMKNMKGDDLKRAAQNAEALRGTNPDQIRAASEQLSSMSPEQLEMMQMQMKNMTPAMLRASAPQYASMSDEQLQGVIEKMSKTKPDDLKKMADQMKSLSAASASSASSSASSASSSDEPPPLTPNSFPAANTNPAAGMDPSAMANLMKGMDPAAMANMQSAMASGDLMKDPMKHMTPEMMQASMDMMKNMSPEMMKNMTDMIGTMGPDAMPGVSPEQLQQVQEQMKNMKPEDMEKLMKWAGRAQKVLGPCSKVCGPIFKVVSPCARAALPRCKQINALLGGQLLSLFLVAVAIGAYFLVM